MHVDREFFEEHGWLVIRGAVAPDVLTYMQLAFERHVPPPADPTPFTNYQALDVARYDDIYRRWMTEYAGPIIAAVFDCPRVRLLQDTLSLKPANTGAEVPWHQDFSYMAYLSGARAAAVRIALTEDTVDNGCMRVVDGSHRWGLISPLRTLVSSKIVDALPRDRAEGKTHALELQPGDMTVHHSLTFHGSPTNTSDRPRRTFIVHACDADTHIDRQHIPPQFALQVPVDKDGLLTGPLYPLLVGKR
jgi:ectoine hydroxylase-related dioxygenase (phytanoyl-CoA dioxygenase family)